MLTARPARPRRMSIRVKPGLLVPDSGVNASVGGGVIRGVPVAASGGARTATWAVSLAGAVWSLSIVAVLVRGWGCSGAAVRTLTS